MLLLLYPVLFSLGVVVHVRGQIICSTYCKPNQCSGINSNQCNACDLPYTLSSNQCVLPSSSNYIQVADQSTINISPNINDNCGSYPVKGMYVGNSVVTLSSPGPITDSHLSITLIIGIIFYDDWSGARFQISLGNNLIDRYQISAITADTQVNVCSVGTKEHYLKFQATVAHTDTSSAVSFVLEKAFKNNGYDWGIKQYVIIAEKCHIKCLVCSDATNTQCSECQTGYKLSGSTCEADCLTQYGETSDVKVCVLCDPLCAQCFQISTNCSQCTPTAPNQAFLDGSSCILACPDYFYENAVNHQCTPCSDNTSCLDCDTVNPDICYDCDASAYWLDFECYFVCPIGYFQDGSNCTACHPYCYECTGYPGSCSSCNQGYYIFNSECVICPSDYFAYEPTRQCLECATYCTTGTLDLYFVSQNKLECDICFSQPVDFSTFPYETFQQINFTPEDFPIDRIQITYQVISQTCYKISIEAALFVVISNANVTVSILPNSSDYYSSTFYKFNPSIFTLEDSEIWNYDKSPAMTQPQIAIINPIININDELNNFFGQQWVQEIKKTGIFAYLMPGVQLSSTVVMHNSAVAENYYEAVRFWSIFVYFQVPRWQEDSSYTKYLVIQPVNSLIQSDSPSRRLAEISQLADTWRFQRTGHTTYFIFDAYMPLCIIFLSLFMNFIAYCLRNTISKRAQSAIYLIIHKIHEVSMFYIILSFLLEWLLFYEKTTELLRYISLGTSILACLYLFFYQLHVFYRLIGFAYVDPISQKYAEYIVKYGYFLRDLRYEEYIENQEWKLCHLFRPYNYQLMGFYRLFMILAALPLFQEVSHGSVGALVAIQGLQIIRYLLTWPYHSLWRNLYKLFLQATLLFIFILYTIVSVMYQQIFTNINSTSESEVELYYLIGWVGFYTFSAYNILFMFYFLIEIIFTIRFTIKSRVIAGRKLYYEARVDEYINKKGSSKCCYIRRIEIFHNARQQSNISEVSKQKLLKQFINKGNLLERDPFLLKKLRVDIEILTIKISSGHSYQIECEKTRDIYMKTKKQEEKENQILTPTKKNTQIQLEQGNSKFYFKAIDDIFQNYASFSTECIKIVTYVRVDHNNCVSGQRIDFDDAKRYQEIQVVNQEQKVNRYKLTQLIKGFPVPDQFIIEDKKENSCRSRQRRSSHSHIISTSIDFSF